MKINHQKQHERFLLERFLEKSGIDAQIVEEREAPDFIVKVDKILVGVEVTEIFISHEKGRRTPQAQESISDQIVAKARRLYLAEEAPPVHVSLCFGPGQDLSNLNRDKTARILCDFMKKMNLSLWQRGNWRFSELQDDEESPLPEEISFIHALGVPSYDMGHWDVARAGWVASLSPESLQERIEAKAKRLLEYKNIIPENWLLVVADAMKPSSSIEASKEFDHNAVTSPFSRTFFYRYPDGFLELRAPNTYKRTE